MTFNIAPDFLNKTGAKEESETDKIRDFYQGFSLLGMI